MDRPVLVVDDDAAAGSGAAQALARRFGADYRVPVVGRS